MESINTILENWLSDTQVDLVKNYEKLGLKASGNWAESLEPYIKRASANNVKAGILGADYTQYIENGRGPNKNQGEEAIKNWVGWAGSTFLKQWVKDKGLNLNPFAVAYKIARSGWDVPNKYNAGGLVSDVVTKERVNDLMRKLSLSFLQDLKSDVIKTFK